MTKSGKRTLLAFACVIVFVTTLLTLFLLGNPVRAYAGPVTSLENPFDGGLGTAARPYLISKESQLKAIGTVDMSAHYRLTSDITLSNSEWVPIGGLYNQNNTDLFQGTFDGNGHTISNLKRFADISEVNNRIYFGLFSRIGNLGTVKNLTMRDCNIYMTGPSVNNANTRVFVGCIAGFVQGTVSNVTVGGICSYDVCTNGMAYVGSVAGVATSAKISGCTNRAAITGGRYSSGAGGIAGHSSYTTFTNCTNYGVITAKRTVWGGSAAAGGIVGELHENNVSSYANYFISCYHYGNVDAIHYGGGASNKEYKGDLWAAPSPYVYE